MSVALRNDWLEQRKQTHERAKDPVVTVTISLKAWTSLLCSGVPVCVS